MKTSNKDCRKFVDDTEPFKAHQLYAENVGHLYVVFSYGQHWPMWVYDRRTGEWIGTDSKYSSSTSRQQSQSRPSEFPLDGKRFHIEHMLELVREARYQPKTGHPCWCKSGVERDNCAACEGTGQQIDFAAIRGAA